jgi:predicted nuclease of predicted toxin-antitoxin system
VKILVDMNLSPEWVPFLRQAGFDCVHWSAVGDPRATDAELMAWARTNDHVVFTHDMDFGALLASTRATGPSVLQARVKDTMPSSLGGDVVRVLHFRREALEQGALVTIDKLNSRVRVLPIGASSKPDEPA